MGIRDNLPIGDWIYVRKTARSNRLPAVMLLAQLVITLLCIMYVLRLIGMYLDMTVDGDRDIVRVVMIGMNVGCAFTAAGALTGLTSRRAKSCRWVIISCITFALFSWVSVLIMNPGSYSSYFIVDPVWTTVFMVFFSAVLLVSCSVRSFYTPPFRETPSVGEWARFVFYGDPFDMKDAEAASKAFRRKRRHGHDDDAPSEDGTVLAEEGEDVQEPPKRRFFRRKPKGPDGDNPDDDE